MAELSAKNVYLVRHGETTFNAARMHQDGSAPLSPLGIRQADFLADRFSRIDVDIILSSSYIRARETAERISKTIGAKVVFDDHFRERDVPSELVGKLYTDPAVMGVQEAIHQHIDDPDWRYSDEENFSEFRERAKRCVEMIESRPEKDVLVVSHSHTIRAIVGFLMLPNGTFTYDMFRHFAHFFELANTGITLCRREEGREWRLVTWNDHSHLG